MDTKMPYIGRLFPEEPLPATMDCGHHQFYIALPMGEKHITLCQECYKRISEVVLAAFLHDVMGKAAKELVRNAFVNVQVLKSHREYPD